MKVVYGILLFLLFFRSLGQDNIIYNYSFEDTSKCPDMQGTIYFGYAKGWYMPNGGSSDYFNECASSGNWWFGVPMNFFGNQNAKTGAAYAGFFLYAYSSNLREYIAGHLKCSLVANKKYCIDFYVSLADTSRFALDKIGAYLSIDCVKVNTTDTLPYLPQVVNQNGIIDDTVNWVLISGEYIAQGGERFISIGNFSSNGNSQIDTFNNNTSSGNAYYYIDDVSITLCDSSFTCKEMSANTWVQDDTVYLVNDSAQVYFYDSTQYATERIWNFGDGTIDTLVFQEDVIHYYTDTGTYNVSYSAKFDSCRVDKIIKVVVLNSVGIQEFQNKNYELQIFPNPARDKISVIAKGGDEIYISDIAGRKITSFPIDQRDFNISIFSLKSGVYFLCLLKDNQILSVKKFVFINE